MPGKRKFTKEEQRERVLGILAGLDESYADARCELDHHNAVELLIATILSAQCTDERVNIVTRDLFRKYPGPKDYLAVSQEVLEADVRSTGFYRNKAKSIRGACRMIIEKFHGKVPDTMEELIQLPGVARKTANVVLGVIWGKAEGIVVDTHVHRVARRLELTSEDTPEKIERDLMKLVPRDRWIAFSHQMILHGRRVCRSRAPMCCNCVVEEICRSKDKVAALPLSRPPKGNKSRTAGRRP